MALAHPIRPRRSDLSFEGLPRHWFGGNALATHVINGLHMLFPAGERYFIRTVHRYLSEVTDEALVAQVRGFFGQEAQHAAAHERCFVELERQGFAVDRFLAAYQRVAFGMIEPITPPRLRLAITVALEHYTAVLADIALRSGILETADPTMKQLLQWHAAEEIEHKSVTFEVMRVTGGHHATRVLGMVVATALLGSFWVAGTTSLLVQDPEVTWKRFWEEAAVIRQRSPLRRNFLRSVRDYLRKDFHPSQHDNLALAQSFLGRPETTRGLAALAPVHTQS